MPPNSNKPDQYDFIMNPGSPQQPKLKIGNSMTSRIIIVLGGLLLLIVIFAVAASMLGKGDQQQTDRLVKIAQTQTELIRVSALGKEKAKDISTKNLAANTHVSVQSSFQDIKAILSGRGLGEKALANQISAAKSAETDEELKQAEQNNRFDEVFQKLLIEQAGVYQADLQAAFENGSETEKEAINSAYASVGVLTAKKQ